MEIREAGGAVTLKIRVQPRASRDAITGERGGALLVRLTAPPVEGAANVALIRLLGKALGVAPSRIRVVSGERGRDKVVSVEGVDAGAVRARLSPAAKGTA